jgi:tRNA nucleotidyltransferase (CCA-adding enzyme)
VVATTHPNADLDALGSLAAVRHLHPGAVAVLSQGAEPVARDLLERLGEAAPTAYEQGEVDLAAVEELVVVDTADLGRLGELGERARRGELTLTVYDHHGERPSDLPAEAVYRSATTGSNSAFLAEQLRQSGAQLSPAEATLLASGIYEDTGMLTFAGVTAADFDAARWLHEQGADLALVGRVLRQDLAPQQLHLLDQILTGLRPVPGLHHRVLVAAVSDPDRVQDAAAVVQRALDIREVDGLLVLLQQDARVFCIARARLEGPDVGAVAAELGGGGHAYAASASLPGVPLAEAEERLLAALQEHDGRLRQLDDIATHRLHSLSPQATLDEAGDMLARYPIKRMPVVDEVGRPHGYVDQGLVERARLHGLAEASVADYAAELPTLTPEGGLRAAASWILDRDYPLVGLVDAVGTLAGLVTRSDLLRALREDFPDGPLVPEAEGGGRSRRDLSGRMRSLMDAATVADLQSLGALAAEQGVRAFLVGGLVRDLLMNRRNTDVDLVVEGDAIALAEAFAARHDYHVHSHGRFGTAVVQAGDGRRLDLATSRIEHYPFPAALPEVEHGSIKADLFRRDFTVNAMAVEVDGDAFGRLLDLFGGLQDLRQSTLRVMHSLSFVEDPTRILRGVRFEAELDFAIETQTERLARRAVDMDLPGRLSGHRLFRELRYLLSSSAPGPGVRRLQGLDLLRFIHPELAGQGGVRAAERVSEGQSVLGWYRLLYRAESVEAWRVGVLLLLWELGGEALESVLTDFELRARTVGELAGDRRRADAVADTLRRHGGPEGDPAARFEALEGLTLAGCLALMAVCEDRVRAAVSDYLQHQRGLRPALSGDDLLALGVPAGPAVGEWLRELTRARVRGEVADRAGEEARVRAGRGSP